jgi:hypothetical protein
MNIRKSFTRNPEGLCVLGSLIQPKSECLFDYWTIHHFYYTGFVYIILHHLLQIKTVKYAILLSLFISILHGIEEYLGNTTKYSLEGFFGDYIAPLFFTNIDVTKRTIDNDYLENSIGDVLSGVIACILIIIYWKVYNKLPYWYLYGIFSIFIMIRYKVKKMWSIDK